MTSITGILLVIRILLILLGVNFYLGFVGVSPWDDEGEGVHERGHAAAYVYEAGHEFFGCGDILWPRVSQVRQIRTTTLLILIQGSTQKPLQLVVREL